MNENNYIQTIGENSTLQDSIIENMNITGTFTPLVRIEETIVPD